MENGKRFEIGKTYGCIGRTYGSVTIRFKVTDIAVEKSGRKVIYCDFEGYDEKDWPVAVFKDRKGEVVGFRNAVAKIQWVHAD